MSDAQLRARKVEETARVLEEQLSTVGERWVAAEEELYLVERSLERSGSDIGSVEEKRLRRRVLSMRDLHDEIRMRLARMRSEQASSEPEIRILDAPTVSSRRTVAARIGGRLATLVLYMLLAGATALFVGNQQARSGDNAFTTSRDGPTGDVTAVLVMAGASLLAVLATLLLVGG